LCLYFSDTCLFFSFFFFNDPPTTEIYTLSLHDALPISSPEWISVGIPRPLSVTVTEPSAFRVTVTSVAWPASASSIALSTTSKTDRKSTRLNSSHVAISYAVFCLKKKKTTQDSTEVHI